MDYFADPQETASRFGDSIEDFHDVFRCNDVDFGFPADFFTFARRLNHDSELRGDVLRVVKGVMEREANISFRDILTIIAVGSGGPDVTASKLEMSVPVNLIIEALTAHDPHSGFNTAQSGGSYSDLAEDKGGQIPAAAQVAAAVQIPVEAPISASAQIPAALQGYSPEGGGAIDRTDLNERCHQGTTIGPVDGLSVEQGPSIDEVSSSVDGVSKTLPEILTRLKLNALRVKVYFQSFEQRFSRMETRWKTLLPTLALSGPTVHPSGDGRAARFYAANATGTGAKLLDHDPPRPNQLDRWVAESLATVTRLWTDVRQFYSSRRQVEVSVLSFAATLVLIGSLVWSIGRHTGYAVVPPMSASVEGVSKPAAVSAAPLAASSASDMLAAPTGESQSEAVADSPVSVDDRSSMVSAGIARGSKLATTNSYTAKGVSRPQTSQKATPVSFKSLPPPTSSPGERASDETTADASEKMAMPDHSYSLSSKQSSNRVIDVSSGVMAANLVSSSKPSYPKLASLIRAQGNVVMQAIISKTGSVEHVNVLKGHRLLRGAAKEAVKTWRYQPYKVNGVPVEVATIVSVEFTLNR